MDEQTAKRLHDALANELLRRVESGEAGASDLSVARQFLKDNGIDATPQQSEPLIDLAKSLPFPTQETGT
jgi:hypothetical protein